MSSNSRIFYNYSRSCSNFYNSYDEKAQPSSGNTTTFGQKDLGWKVPLIPKLEKYFNAHYLCPKCFQFPLIDFISKEYIYYKCFCEDRGGKDKDRFNEKILVKIKDLFNKDNKYMTFLNNYISINSSPNSKDESKGLKCTEEHESKKNRKFRYYCTGCEKNICSECVGEHISNRPDKKEKHDLIVLDYQRINDYEKIININKKIKEENDRINNESFKFNEFFEEEETEMEIMLENKVIQIKEESGDKFDYFTEFINIIINDYQTYPNYFHTHNIESIFFFLVNKKNFGMKINT